MGGGSEVRGRRRIGGGIHKIAREKGGRGSGRLLPPGVANPRHTGKPPQHFFFSNFSFKHKLTQVRCFYFAESSSSSYNQITYINISK